MRVPVSNGIGRNHPRLKKGQLDVLSTLIIGILRINSIPYSLSTASLQAH